MFYGLGAVASLMASFQFPASQERKSHGNCSVGAKEIREESYSVSGCNGFC